MSAGPPSETPPSETLSAGLRLYQEERYPEAAVQFQRIARHVQRFRGRQVVGNGKRRAVGQDTHRPRHGELAQRRQILIDGEGGQSPGPGTDRIDPCPQLRFDKAILRLEMLWPKEHAFVPGDPIFTSQLLSPNRLTG